MPCLPYALARDEGERLEFGDALILLRMTAEGSGGSVTIWEELAPLLDTPLHVHANEDELFQIIEGERKFRCGEHQFRVGPERSSASPGASRTLTPTSWPAVDASLSS